MAGKRICGPFVGIFDAVQADLEFVRKIFNLQRTFEAIYGAIKPMQCVDR